MACSKLSTDIGAQNLIDTIGCLHSETLHVDKKKWFSLFKDTNTKYLALSKRLPSKKASGLYCFASIFAPKAEFAYTTLELQSSKTFETTDRRGFVIHFEDVDKSPLKFICAGKKESEVWVEKINEAISSDKHFSADSGYASGGSITNEQIRKIPTFEMDTSQQQGGLYDVIDDKDVDSTNPKIDEELTYRKELIADEIGSSDLNQTKLAETGKEKLVYEYSEEQRYLNVCFGKQHSGVPETGTQVAAQYSFKPSNIRAKEQANLLAQEFKERKPRAQKKLDVYPSADRQNNTSGNNSVLTFPKKPLPATHVLETPSFCANDYDDTFVSVREHNSCGSMGYLSVESGEDFSIPNSENVRPGDDEDGEVIYENFPASHVDEACVGNAGSAKVNENTDLIMRKRSTEQINESGSRTSTISGNRTSTLTTDSAKSDEIITGVPLESSDEEPEKSLKPEDYMCQNKEEAKRVLKGKPSGTFAICVADSSSMVHELLVRFNSKLYCYKIYYRAEKYRISKDVDFETIEKLIDFYLVVDLPKLDNRAPKISLGKGWST